MLSSPPSVAVPEDERLNNLWRYDLPTGRWHRVTGFTAGSDRWTAIRTPIRRGDGSLEFVTISGSRIGDARAQVRPLVAHRRRRPRAARAPRRAVPRRRDRRRSPLERARSPHRPFHHPPRGRRWPVDAHRVRVGDDATRSMPSTPTAVPAAGGSRRLAVSGRTSTARRSPRRSPQIEVGILVGDFQDRGQAEAAAARIAAVFGAAAPVSVVDAASAPDAIRPGVFGALLRLEVRRRRRARPERLPHTTARVRPHELGRVAVTSGVGTPGSVPVARSGARDERLPRVEPLRLPRGARPRRSHGYRRLRRRRPRRWSPRPSRPRRKGPLARGAPHGGRTGCARRRHRPTRPCARRSPGRLSHELLHGAALRTSAGTSWVRRPGRARSSIGSSRRPAWCQPWS